MALAWTKSAALSRICAVAWLFREDGLSALARKRTHIDGAGFFWTIPRMRDLRLLRALHARRF
jgi:hypothetical protein